MDEVTNAIVEAHMSTTINTHANVAQANERIQREINEMVSIKTEFQIYFHFLSEIFISKKLTLSISCLKQTSLPFQSLSENI